MKLEVHGRTLHGAVRDPRTGALVWAPGGINASRAFAEECHAKRLAELLDRKPRLFLPPTRRKRLGSTPLEDHYL